MIEYVEKIKSIELGNILNDKKLHLVPSYYIACITLVRALVYCNFLRKVRLGGWGTEGPKSPTLDGHLSVYTTILRLRALLCLCASHLGVRYYIVTSI